MTSLASLLSVAHLIGLGLGVGCATAKLTLLLRCKADHTLVPAYFTAARPITRLIILGLGLLVLSGLGWLLLGYPVTAILVVKLTMVGVIVVIGPIIDNLVEPKFKKLAPGPGESAAPEFTRIQQQYLTLEVIATALFYVIIVMWVLA